MTLRGRSSGSTKLELVREADGPIGPGSAPQSVRALQELVNRATAQRIVVDGVYGEKTLDAVRFLQRRLDLPQTGHADALTLVLTYARIEQALRDRHAPRRFLVELPKRPDGAPVASHLIIEAAQKLFIPKELQKGGLRTNEPETLAPFLAALELFPKGLFLDIGANVGVFSLLASALSDARVVAFEPTPELAATARRIAEINGFPIQLQELALGRTTTIGTFYLSDVTDASNSLAAGFRASHESVEVRVETLDDWCARSGEVPAVIKIDTETTEPDVLAGGRQVLARTRPWIICEVLPGRRSDDLVAELEPLGYTWHHLLPGQELAATTALAPSEEHRNWLFTPEPLSEDFIARSRAWAAAIDALPTPQAD